jgi:hypothetical protein
MGILQNIEEDSEIRIAAYKVLMDCPTDKVLGVVRNTLAKEEVNQVPHLLFLYMQILIELWTLNSAKDLYCFLECFSD